MPQLQQIVPHLNWRHLFYNLSGRNISNEDKIQLKLNIENLNRILTEFTFNELKTTILGNIAHDYYTDFVQIQESYCDRKRYCTETMLNTMPDIMSRILIKFHLNTRQLDAIDKGSTKMFK